MRRRTSGRGSSRRDPRDILRLAIAVPGFTAAFMIAVYWLALWTAYVDAVFP